MTLKILITSLKDAVDSSLAPLTKADKLPYACTLVGRCGLMVGLMDLYYFIRSTKNLGALQHTPEVCARGGA